MMQERNAQRMDRDCMKVAVLSEIIYNLLRPQVAALLGTCDAVIHAGDIGSLQLMDAVREAAGQEAPAFFVRETTTENGRKGCRKAFVLHWAAFPFSSFTKRRMFRRNWREFR